MIIKQAELETVCGITSKLPENEWPEVAFAGKSNVGKSSLINGLLNRSKRTIGLGITGYIKTGGEEDHSMRKIQKSFYSFFAECFRHVRAEHIHTSLRMT